MDAPCTRGVRAVYAHFMPKNRVEVVVRMKRLQRLDRLGLVRPVQYR